MLNNLSHTDLIVLFTFVGFCIGWITAYLANRYDNRHQRRELKNAMFLSYKGWRQTQPQNLLEIKVRGNQWFPAAWEREGIMKLLSTEDALLVQAKLDEEENLGLPEKLKSVPCSLANDQQPQFPSNYKQGQWR